MDLLFENTGSASTHQLLRRAGYSPIRDYKTKKESYVRTLGPQHYPRFHVYILEEAKESFKINLHLDMKKASYEGQARHSGEYDGPQVAAEAQRIQEVFSQQQTVNTSTEQKRSIWDRIFK